MYLKAFLRDVYPGAKKSPVNMAKMLAMPDVGPHESIEGT